jgi:hypothetical protein
MEAANYIDNRLRDLGIAVVETGQYFCQTKKCFLGDGHVRWIILDDLKTESTIIHKLKLTNKELRIVVVGILNELRSYGVEQIRKHVSGRTEDSCIITLDPAECTPKYLLSKKSYSELER